MFNWLISKRKLLDILRKEHDYNMIEYTHANTIYERGHYSGRANALAKLIYYIENDILDEYLQHWSED